MLIKQIMIFVDDINMAKEFYNKKLKIGILKDLSHELDMLIMKSENIIFTIHGGFKMKPHDGSRKISITFSVDNIHDETKRLKELGIKLIDGIEETPIHWFQAFEDPAGNMIEIGQYK